ncbi:DUF541 domain-containing protein [Ancylomarina euxinus]|uniref:DUF541 domain-containing protein n=1 Tax=Ancylomarina euxinus TaxID=2283627 RepID=A0A425XZU7_9BACT|nr:SIMPL domain-containing protein [Ancylomarina euxinus]MCZ4695371.1 SIMPL domain-containing protein [Ancylomarina euxinus]MUP15567.1 DUF541 domain-containing protein [Ancylomarina euxinus]RRG20989.1 DUF541 domain-containing protein [Ancylomarina euxinus]
MKQFILLGFALLITQFSSAQSGTKNFIDQHYIEVNGNAKMEIIPDEIYLNINLSERDTKNKESVDQLENKMFKALKQIGIDLEKQLSVQDFTSNFQTYFLKKKDIMKSKDFQVIVHDTKTLSSLFSSLEKIGISNIQIEKVDHSKIEEFKLEVKVKAIKDAKAKAKALTAALNQEIGKAIYINEGSYNTYQARPQDKRMMIRGMASIAMEDAAPQIEFQKIELENKIMVRFELK